MPKHFPGYDDPRAAGPGVLRPFGAPCATLRLFDREPLQGWGAPSYARVVPPTSPGCAGPWAHVQLDFAGEVKGVQFDRMGALWIGNAHVLRLTTPEPSPEGIRWQLQRDLTDYWPLFRSPSNATLQIDNTVDDTYTGILFISANLTFYPATPSTAPATEALLLPLHAGLSYGENAWEAASTVGGENRSYTLTLPQRNLRLAHIDVYASGHGCEEFWYTNVPDEDFEPDSGACAGGTYREIQLYVDGLLAGALYPFPTIYTGGVCPLLWRPLTGIYSFNVPPYRFDITPFLGLLNDGQPHEIATKVFGQGEAGTWFLDMVLVGSRSRWLKVCARERSRGRTAAPGGAAPSASEPLRRPFCTNRHDPHFEVLTGRLLEHTVQPPQVRVQHPKADDESYLVTTDGGSSLRVTGLLEPVGGGGTALVTTLQAKLTAHNENRMGRVGELEAGDSSGLMEAIVDRAVVLTAGLSSPLPLLPGVPAVPLWQRVSEFRYPYLVRDMDGQ
eukprot:scaffold107980_cov60-Phaeocystis_antarctica.AAC.1